MNAPLALGPPVWVAELADRFWAAAGPPPPAPRDLTGPITNAVPLGIVERPGLTLTGTLRRDGLPAVFAGPDRPLRAAGPN